MATAVLAIARRSGENVSMGQIAPAVVREETLHGVWTIYGRGIVARISALTDFGRLPDGVSRVRTQLWEILASM